jgi:hypothetical protein
MEEFDMTSKHRLSCFVFIVSVLVLQSNVWAGHRIGGYNRAELLASSPESTEGQARPTLGYYTLDALRVDGNPWNSEGQSLLAGQSYDVAMDFSWHVAEVEGEYNLTTYDQSSTMLVQILGVDVMSGILAFAESEPSDGIGATFAGILLYNVLDGQEGLTQARIDRQGTDLESWLYDVTIENPVADEPSSEVELDDTAPVPVPSAVLLLSAGLAGLARFRRRWM